MPVLAISGQVPSKVLGRGAFQDLDLTAIFRDVAAWTAEVHAGSDHAELAALAVKHALDARGVAHLVLPDEVQTQPSDAAVKTPQGRLAGRLTQPGQAELAVLIKEVRAQQTAMAANQVKISEKLATLAESIRVARIYSSRGGR